MMDHISIAVICPHHPKGSQSSAPQQFFYVSIIRSIGSCSLIKMPIQPSTDFHSRSVHSFWTTAILRDVYSRVVVHFRFLGQSLSALRSRCRVPGSSLLKNRLILCSASSEEQRMQSASLLLVYSCGEILYRAI